MLSAYETIIMEATGVMMPDELKVIEEIMRGENGNSLRRMDKSELTALAKDAKEAFDAIKALGA